MQYFLNDSRVWDDKFALSTVEGQAVMLCAQRWAELMEPYLDTYSDMDMTVYEHLAFTLLGNIWPNVDPLQQKQSLLAICDVLSRYGWKHMVITGCFREGLELDIRNEEASRRSALRS